MISPRSLGASVEGETLHVAAPMVTIDYSSLELLVTRLSGEYAGVFFLSESPVDFNHHFGCDGLRSELFSE